jgi:hypothetical protein
MTAFHHRPSLRPTLRLLLVSLCAVSALAACNKRPADQPPTPTTMPEPAAPVTPAPTPENQPPAGTTPAITPDNPTTTPPPPASAPPIAGQ